MSTAENVDPDMVEQTKQQIRNLVREIAQLSKSDVQPLEFYDQLLNRVVSALAAIGGAIWVLNDSGQLELQYQINLRETKLGESQENQVIHGRTLRRALSAPEGLLVPPHSSSGEGDEQEGNPTDFLLVLGSLKTDSAARGVIEVFQRPGSTAAVQRGYLRFLLQMCEYAGDFLKTRELRSYTNRQTLWSQLEQFTRAAHRSLDPRETAYVIANEGRRLIECDRVSVAIKRGKRCYIEAVSGQDTFDKRSTTVQLLGELATAVAATGEPTWFTGDTSDMAPQVEEAVQAYVDESHSKTVAIIPLKKPEPPPSAEQQDLPPPEVIGCLIVEQIEDSSVREGLMTRVDVVSEHSSTALTNALQHHGLFLLPVWKKLGEAQWVLQARTLPKTIAIAVASVALILFLCLWPADFYLIGKGTLEPVVKRDVFAAVDGVVSSVNVKHGDLVPKDALLAEMRNTDLNVKLADVEGQLQASIEQLGSTKRSLEDGKHTADERNRLEGQKLQLQATIKGLREQKQLLLQKQTHLKVTSPIDGQILTWQVHEQLQQRPVTTGQVLLTVADPKGDWQLEINMPENRMGHIARAQKSLGDELAVRYILATRPGKEYEGKVREIHRLANVRGEEGNTVLVKVAIDKSVLEQDQLDLRPGATVTTKVYCGRASIGYVWLHDLIAFVQTKVLFPL